MLKKILLGILFVIVAIVGLAFWATSGMTERGDAFFNALKSHDYQTAYTQFMSSRYKANIPQNEFVAYVKSNDLDKVASVDWDGRMAGSETELGKGTVTTGDLNGTVHTVDGKSFPVRFKLIKENEEWKVDTFGRAVDFSTVPPQSEQERLAIETVSVFVHSIAQNDFNLFYRAIAELWRKQTTPDMLKKNFTQVLNTPIPWETLASMSPQFERKSYIDNRGELWIYPLYRITVQGVPVKVLFTLGYGPESGTWKLMNIGVKAKSEQKGIE